MRLHLYYRLYLALSHAIISLIIYHILMGQCKKDITPLLKQTLAGNTVDLAVLMITLLSGIWSAKLSRLQCVYHIKMDIVSENKIIAVYIHDFVL